MIFKRKYFLFLLPLLFFVYATALPAQEIRVGFYHNPPLSFVDEEENPQGFLIDLKEAAQKENWRLDFVFCDWNECLRALEAGEIDLLGPIAYSEERSKRFDFSEETLITNWGQVYVQSGETDVSILDLDGKTLVAIEDDIHTKNLRERLSRFGFSVKFIFVDNYDEVLKKVENREAFGGIVNHLYALQYAKKYKVEQSAIIFNPIEVRFAVTKGEHNEFLSALDQEISIMKADKTSIYYQRLNAWFDNPVDLKMPLWAKWLSAFLFVLVITLIVGSVSLRIIVKRRTAELEESEAKYRSLVDNALVGVYITQNYFIRFANQGLADLFGYSSGKEIIGLHIKKMVASMSWDKVNEEVHLKESGKKKASFYRFKGLRKNGDTIDVEVLGVAIEYQGQPAIQGVLIDITERIRAEERFKHLSEAAFEAIIISEKGVILEANHAAEQFFGYSVEETIGMSITEIVALVDRDLVIHHALSGYEKPYTITALRKDNSTFFAEVNGRMMRYEGRTVRVTSIRDISAKVKAKKALRKRTEELELLNTIAYTLSTSLNLDDLLTTILEEAARVIKFDSAAIFLVEEDGRVSIDKAIGEAVFYENRKFTLQETFLENIHLTPLILDDAQSTSGFSNWENVSTKIRGWMGLPLIARDLVLGYLTFDSNEPRAFSPQDAALAESFSPHIAHALYNARLLEEIIQEVAKIEKEIQASNKLDLAVLNETLKTLHQKLKKAQQVPGASDSPHPPQAQDNRQRKTAL